MLAAVVGLALSGGCATRVAVTAPALADAGGRQAATDAAPQAWWQTYGDDPRRP
jgi:hypothetical protein